MKGSKACPNPHTARKLQVVLPSTMELRCDMMGPGCRIATHLRLYLRPWEPKGPGGFILYDGKEAKIEKKERTWMTHIYLTQMDEDVQFDAGVIFFSGKKMASKPAAHVWWGCCRPPLKEIPEGAYDLVFYLLLFATSTSVIFVFLC